MPSTHQHSSKKLTILAAAFLAIITFACLVSSDSTNDGTLWIRGAAVYDGEVNTFIMTKEAMESGAISFIGKPILLGHEWGDPHACVGTIVDAALRHDPVLNRDYIEFIAIVNDVDAEARIRKEFFKRLSIGFEIQEVVCSLDNHDMRFCGHSPGSWYMFPEGFKQALGVIKKLSGYEISFVNVPASAPARVFEWSDYHLELSISN